MIYIKTYTKIFGKSDVKKFKEWKLENNITKRSFSFFKRKRKQRNDQKPPPRTRNYRRKLDEMHMWIYFTSSNFLHNIPWIKSLDNF